MLLVYLHFYDFVVLLEIMLRAVSFLILVLFQSCTIFSILCRACNSKIEFFHANLYYFSLAICL